MSSRVLSDSVRVNITQKALFRPIETILLNLLQDARNIPWRGDSGLKDGCLESVDLSGGWYHGSDYVKHGLPTAAAATVMLWGLVDYKEAYQATGEYEFGKKQLKWIVDYYMKAHVSKYELYVQVRNFKITWLKISSLRKPVTNFSSHSC